MSYQGFEKIKNKNIMRLLFILVVLSGGIFQSQHYYKWVDKKGTIHFSDQANQVPSNSIPPTNSKENKLCLDSKNNLELLKEGLWVSDKASAPRGALSTAEIKKAQDKYNLNIKKYCGLAKKN